MQLKINKLGSRNNKNMPISAIQISQIVCSTVVQILGHCDVNVYLWFEFLKNIEDKFEM